MRLSREGADEHGPLWQRIEFLEQNNRWHSFALDLLAGLGSVYGESSGERDPQRLVSRTIEQLNRLIDLEFTAILLVREEDSSFGMVRCEPPRLEAMVQREVDRLIDCGEFAWAVNQNQSFVVDASAIRGRVLLNVIATRNRVRGMLVAGVGETGRLTEPLRQTVAIIVNTLAYTLESLELYRWVSDQNRNLEAIVQRRTRELEYQFNHDSLTGLASRLVLMTRLRHAIAGAQRNGLRIAVINLDLDVFKRINDSFGHGFGDELLKGVAERLQRVLLCDETYAMLDVEPSDVTLARPGGDEFSVLISGMPRIEPLLKLVRGIETSLRSGFEIRGIDVHVTASIGISVYPDDAASADDLLRNADAALHHVKSDGRNAYQFFACEINAWTAQRLHVERRIRHALAHDEFIVHYQPMFELDACWMHRAEALLRLPAEDGVTFISPCEFIPVAEATGLIQDIGEWVLRAVAQQIREWRGTALEGLSVSVNLSALQLRHADLAEVFCRILDEAGVSPRSIELELTESAITQDTDRAAACLAGLNDSGFAIAVDDFGTGYSSLLLLKRFPIDTLKIDRSFVHELPHNSDDEAIVAAVLAMARSLRLDVVAEGVETPEQLAALRRLGCTQVQGFLLGRPADAAEFARRHRDRELNGVPATGDSV